IFLREVDGVRLPFPRQANIVQRGHIRIWMLADDAADAKFMHALSAVFAARPEREASGAAQIIARASRVVPPIVGGILPINAHPSFGPRGFVIHTKTGAVSVRSRSVGA